ncbi:MAG TPA: hypothetical protein DCS93_11410 [Microscillaceae bacterium]|nr:hypothetical protein [Microscillaceae bacterium]
MRSSIRKNDIALQMLHTNPFELICSKEYQEIILKVVRKFRQTGGFKQESDAEVVQEITTCILEKVSHIQKNYAPEYGSFKPYFARIVYNFGLDLIKAAQKRQNLNNGLTTAPPDRSTSEVKPEVLADELKNLSLYLSKNKRHQAKFVLLLKLYSRSTIQAQDIQNFLPKVSPDALIQTLEVLGHNYAQLEDRFLYQYINALINEVEGKNKSADAIRKWLSARVTELIQWMNRRSQFQYDREALRNLVRLFFMREEATTQRA